MKERSFIITFAIIIFLFITTIIFDSFVIKPTQQTKILQNLKAVKTSGTPGHRSYMTYFFVDDNGIKYNIPYGSYTTLKSGDSFQIYKTKIYKKVVAISYEVNISKYYQNIGVINNSNFGLFLIFFVAFLSIACFFSGFIKIRGLPIKLSLLSIMLTLVISYFYFIFQA